MRSISRRHILLSRTVQSCLALAVISPAAAFAEGDYTIYTPGLYDSSASVGGHIAANGVSNETISFFNTAGAVSGTAVRYVSNANNANATGNSAGNNAWYYNPATHSTLTIGFTGAAYTMANSLSTSLPNGTQSSTIRAMDNFGDVLGTSTQYLSTSTAGTTAWLATADGTTTAIRLANETGVVYTKGSNTTNGSAGAESSSVVAMNASGLAVGSSARFNSSNLTNEGSSAWIASVSNGTVSITRIGLTGTAYAKTSDTSFQSSSVTGINANGQASGTSQNYSVNAAGSPDAWFYDGSNTTLIGLSNASNYVQSTTTLAPTVGGVAGVSSTTNFNGQTAWVYKIQAANSTTASATIPVSLAGTTVPNGAGRAFYYGGTGNSNITYQSSTINAINASGQAIGFQSFYPANGTTATAGQDAFFFNGTTTQVVGLTSSDYTAGTGSTTVRSNAVTLLNDNGQMAGTTAFYKGGNISLGRDAWTYNAGDAPDLSGNYGTPIGLAFSTSVTHGPYINPITLGHSSTVAKINSVGQVIGSSTRYLSDGSSGGADAYLYTPGDTSIPVGTFGDPDHSFSTSNGVIQSSTVSLLNNSGLAAGISLRYTSNGTANGQDAWAYDSATSTKYPISLPNSISSTTGSANETVQFLSDKGLLLGSYTKYDPTTDANLGTFAYAFTESKGAFDLGLDTKNFTDANWQQLDATFAANLNNYIVGYGTLANDTVAYASGSNQAIYLLQHFLLGDANDDGKVDLNDLNIVLNHLGETSSLRSDGNFDGAPTIDLNDLNDVLNNLGVTDGTSSAVLAAEGLVANTAATPEPASLGILALGGMVLLRRRTRR